MISVLLPVTKLCRNNTMFIKKLRLGVRVGVRARARARASARVRV